MKIFKGKYGDYCLIYVKDDRFWNYFELQKIEEKKFNSLQILWRSLTKNTKPEKKLISTGYTLVDNDRDPYFEDFISGDDSQKLIIANTLIKEYEDAVERKIKKKNDQKKALEFISDE